MALTELCMALTAAIEELPPGYRTVLILHDVEGLSNLEVAETLGLGVPNVKSRVHRARLLLRKRLASMSAWDATTATPGVMNNNGEGSLTGLAVKTVDQTAGGLPECRVRRVAQY